MRLRIIASLVSGMFVAGGAAAQAPAQPPTAARFTAPEEVQPVPGARPLDMKSIDALRGDGLFYFSGTRVVNLRASDKPQGDRYPLTESTSDLGISAFSANIDVQNFVRDGERRPIGDPDFAVPAQDGSMQLIYNAAHPLRLSVTIKGYDVAGLQISDFLRTAENYARPEAAKAAGARFPAGSVAYIADARFVDDVLMLPRRESFTGAANVKQMVANFSKDVPFCLAYEDRDGATPYALHFRGSGSKGKTELFRAKSGTMFCARATEQPVAEGTWEERVVGGTHAIVLSFPANVDPLDTGVTPAERNAARIAFVEPTKGTPGVRPGKLYRAGVRIVDFQYRFNSTAAMAIRSALGVP